MKGPLQPLLYLAITGLVLGFGWQFYQLAEFKKTNDQAAKAKVKQKDEDELALLLREAKAAVTEGSVGEVDYRRPKSMWDALKTANFHGYVQPPPPDPVDTTDTPPEVVEVPKTPLDEIFSIEFVVADASDSFVSIRYKAEANIEPPEGFAAGGPTNAGPADAVRRPQGTRRSAQQRNGSRPSTSLPTAFANGEYPHLLRVGETLWEPYSNIRLVSVDTTAEFASFVREDAGVSEDERVEEKLYRPIGILNLDQDILRRLAERGVISEGGRQNTTSSGAADENTGWQDVERTTIIEQDGRSVVNFARNDPVLQDPARIFNEEVGTRTVSTPGGQRGVQVTRVPDLGANYAVETGDILVSLNGEAVSSRSQALRVGRRQYDQGRRTFVAEFLRNGQRVTQTYVAPER